MWEITNNVIKRVFLRLMNLYLSQECRDDWDDVFGIHSYTSLKVFEGGTSCTFLSSESICLIV